jgi:dipeptidyl aminopeptidase/acylaminoacyl peptidase
VPFSQSELLYEALAQAGSEVTFVRIKRAGHGGAAFRAAPVLGMVSEFFESRLRRG